MIALLQRVTEAAVHVNDSEIARIGRGILALVAVQRGDTQAQSDRLIERVLAYRIFPDAEGRMNLDVRQAGGELLLVPQFTLAADTNSGNRPSFAVAATPEDGERMFNLALERAQHLHPGTCSGEFGANMQVSLVNDGPVTFWLEVSPN